MTRIELIDALALRRNLPRSTAEEVVGVFFDALSDTLARGTRVELRGFGSFQVRRYGGYTGRNPRTGQAIAVGEKWLPHFRPGKQLRARVDGEGAE